MNVTNIREQFLKKYLEKDIIYGRGGNTIEIIGASFLANESTIFGSINSDFTSRELEWYKSQSLSIANFPGDAPSTWQDTANSKGEINSNYGWCIYSLENGAQFYHIVSELRKNPHSRRAVAIYTRPSMHMDAVKDGKQDFICTNTVQYLLRYDRLSCVVQMRSNDAIYGYKYDLAWQKYILQELSHELNVDTGDIYWQVGSLHIYERHFKYLREL